jgi:hypothetical protein
VKLKFSLFACADLIVVYMDDKIADLKNLCGNKKELPSYFYIT